MSHQHHGDSGSSTWCCPDFTTLPCSDPHCDLNLVCCYPSSPSSRPHHGALPVTADASGAANDWFDGVVCCEDVSCAPPLLKNPSTSGASTAGPPQTGSSEDASAIEAEHDDCACCAAGCPPEDPKERGCPDCVDSDDVLNEAALQELLKCCCCGDETSPSSFSTHHLTTHPTHDLGTALPSFLFPPAPSLPPASTSLNAGDMITSVSLDSTPALTSVPWSNLNHPAATSPPFGLASPAPTSAFQPAPSVPHPSHHASLSKARLARKTVKVLPPQASRLLPCEWAGCQGYFPSREALVAHVNSAHLSASLRDPEGPDVQEEEGSGDEEVSCQDGTTAAPSPGYLAPHKRARVSTASSTTTASAGAAADGEHQCRWAGCGETFSTTADLTAHLSERHVGSGKGLYVCEWEGCHAPSCAGASSRRASVGTKRKRRRVEEDEAEDEEAEGGGRRQFAQRQKIMRHLQVHTGDRPFVCDTCGRAFGEMATIVQHRRIHTQEKPFRCDFPGCDKSFAIASALTIHRRTHSGAKPFPCPFAGCGAAFAESSNLTKHLRVHTGERPFVCAHEGCGRAFKRSDQLARHRKVHA